MINDHNLNISEQEYRDLDLPSYSMLSSISKAGPEVVNGVKNNYVKLIFGSLVDDMCFDTGNVLKKYHKAGSVKAPTKNVKDIVDIVIETISKGESSNPQASSMFRKKKMNNSSISSDLNQYHPLILSAASGLGIYKQYTDEKIVNTVVSAGAKYFEDNIVSRGKVLVKQEMWIKAMQTATTLASHEFSREFFEEEDDIELIYQYKFVTKVNGRKTKGMLDIVKIDHVNKIIYPVDLKTGEMTVNKFPEIMLMYGYYLQSGLYYTALCNIVKSDPDLAGYEVAPFQFLYISKENPDKPIVHVVTEKVHLASMNGFTDRYGTKHKGVNKLLKEYYDAKGNINCQYTKEEYEVNGKILFDDDLIKEIEDEVEEYKIDDNSDEEFDIFSTGTGFGS